MTELHRATNDSTGDPITSGWVPTSQGDGTIAWAAQATGSGFLQNDTYEGVVSSHGSMGATETMSCANGLYHTGTINANVVITLDGFVNGTLSVMTVELLEDGTGGHTLSFKDPGTDDIVWINGTTPTHVSTANTTEIYEFWSRDGGASIFGGKVGAGGPTDAEDVSIADAGGYYTGTDVEAALQEVGADLAALGVSGGDHEHMIDAFNGDGATTVFEISDEPLDPEAVFAFVGASYTAITVSGAMNTTITFGSAPGSGTANVQIHYPAVAA